MFQRKLKMHDVTSESRQDTCSSIATYLQSHSSRAENVTVQTQTAAIYWEFVWHGCGRVNNKDVVQT